MRSIGAVTATILLSLAARSIPVSTQAPTLEPRLSFEVAAITVNTSRTRTPMQWQPGGHFVGTLPVLSLASIGYQVPAYRIEGLPDWGRTTRFDINARAAHQPEIEERSAYFRGLLVDRFHFAAHVERREMEVYTLTLARSDFRLGPGLRRSDVNCDQAIAEARKRTLAGERPGPPPPGVRPTCGAIGGISQMTGGATELVNLVNMLAQALGKPVVDKTELKGRFDIDFVAAPPGAREGPVPSSLSPISTALEDQLGLKMQTGRGFVEVLVIDRLEMPTDN
jgi:uncharacterized protein (TIGR03435 family)